MTDKELLEKTAKRLRVIADDTQRITSGNISHNLTCLRGFALRAAESIERHLQEPVSEDLEQFCAEYERKVNYEGDIYTNVRIRNAVKAGANWKKQQLIKNVVLETEVLRDSDGDGVDTPYESWLTLANTEIPELPESLGLREGDKVKIVIVKEKQI